MQNSRCPVIISDICMYTYNDAIIIMHLSLFCPWDRAGAYISWGAAGPKKPHLYWHIHLPCVTNDGSTVSSRWGGGQYPLNALSGVKKNWLGMHENKNSPWSCQIDNNWLKRLLVRYENRTYPCLCHPESFTVYSTIQPIPYLCCPVLPDVYSLYNL